MMKTAEVYFPLKISEVDYLVSVSYSAKEEGATLDLPSFSFSPISPMSPCKELFYVISKVINKTGLFITSVKLSKFSEEVTSISEAEVKLLEVLYEKK